MKRVFGITAVRSTTEDSMIRYNRLLCAAAIVAVSAFSASAQTPGQSPVMSTKPMSNPPRTTDGRPDLQGTWNNTSVTRMERPGNVSTLVLTEEEAVRYEQGSQWVVNARNQDSEKVDTNAAPPPGKGSDFAQLGYNSFWLEAGNHLARVKGEVRTSWIVDPPNGKLPAKPGANKAFEGFGSFDTYETRPLSERCILFGRQAGPIMLNSIYNNNMQFVQTPDTVMILAEMVHEARIIPIFKSKAEVKYRPSAIKPWFGDSVGWYEGDALVVETRNVNPAQVQAYISPTGTLTERFSRWSEDQILYEFTVDDPAFYTQAWKGEMSLNRSAQPIYEYACHEGNYSFAGILEGARVLESQGRVPSILVDGE
jgi:hypothetical protein